MKRNLLLLTLLLFSAFTSSAQIFRFGLKVGINYANQTGSTITVNGTNYNAEAISSYHVGLISQIKLSDGFSFQPEVLYSTQGATYKPATVLQDINNKLGYISVPVLAKIHLNNTFSLELGPQASFLLSKKNEVSLGDQNSFDFALVGGLGINITKSIFIQGRYGLGLTEVSTNAKSKNSVVQVSAGLMF